MEVLIAKKTEDCTDCYFCKFMINCNQKDCTGCGQCVAACPNNARVMHKIKRDKKINLTVDGKNVEVPEQITILAALEFLGYTVSHHPKQAGQIFAPCKIGGCGACSVLVNGKLKPSCITKVEDGMEINTETAQIVSQEPIRLANNFEAYQGGVIGAEQNRTQAVTEYTFFAQGCNLRCPACHNWNITFSTSGKYCTPRRAAEIMERGRKHYSVSKVAVTGGEITLNRPWLVQFVKEFRAICEDWETRFQLDTNASMLTTDYIDELYAAGVSDISPDVKGLYPETYMKITGIDDLELAKLCVETTWQAVEYLLTKYSKKMFIVLAIPYHEQFIDLEELRQMAQKIYNINPETCISLIDYMPAFRCRDLPLTDPEKMEEVHQLFLDAGLHKVLWQTGEELGQAMDPDDLFLDDEAF
ncbi:MAG: radical SAM protein [Desulfitobacteriaceae bacterium]